MFRGFRIISAICIHVKCLSLRKKKHNYSERQRTNFIPNAFLLIRAPILISTPIAYNHPHSKGKNTNKCRYSITDYCSILS